MTKKDSVMKVALSAGFLVFMGGFVLSCATTTTKETEYTPSGNVSYLSTSVNKDVIYELRKVFMDIRLEGIGIFENDNEGLARKAAIELAINDLASKVQTKTKSESTIYNNKDVRIVVENQVHALVQGYRIESEGYDPNTIKYRVRISIDGEQIVREIEKMVKK